MYNKNGTCLLMLFGKFNYKQPKSIDLNWLS